MTEVNQLSVTEQVVRLQIKIEKMQEYLNVDFHDLLLGSYQWMEYWELFPEKQDEMLAWQNGPNVTLDITYKSPETIDGTFYEIIWWLKQIRKANEDNFSFALTHDLDESVIAAINQLCSYFKWNIRVRKY